MKILSFILILFILSCSNPIENNVEILTTTYTLPYDRHYDHDTIYMSENPISGRGIIYDINVTPYNFNEDVEYGFVLRCGLYDTLYYTHKIDTQVTEQIKIKLNKNFNGEIIANMIRFETYKKIDFICKITFSYK